MPSHPQHDMTPDWSQFNLPNLLSAGRILALPGLYYLAWTHQPRAFLWLFVAALLTDAIDGPLARRMKVEGPFGARLDSLGDMGIYVSLPVCAWWLWESILRREAVFVVPLILSYFVPLIVGYLKFGRLPCHHTWLAKLSAVLLGGAVILLFAEVTPWPFRVFAALPVVGALEELAITFTLPVWQANVPTLWQARRIRAAQRQAPSPKP